jgi:hypothetical protein
MFFQLTFPRLPTETLKFLEGQSQIAVMLPRTNFGTLLRDLLGNPFRTRRWRPGVRIAVRAVYGLFLYRVDCTNLLNLLGT